MKLDWLKLPRYKNLRDFEINFDESQATTVVLGRNGTGKSNLLEAIVEIFRDLELEVTPKFAYELQYICRDRRINIASNPSAGSSRITITIDGKLLSFSEFSRNRGAYLPNYVFAYYSGWSSRLENHFSKTTREHYNAVLNSRNERLPLRRMFFCRREYSQLVLLAFFLANSEVAQAFLTKYLQIESFESALFVLKRPSWAKGGGANKLGDSRFWNARGAFRAFLGELWRHALAPIRRNEMVDRDIRRQGERTERLYVFVKDQATLELLGGDGRPNPTQLFGYLEGLFLCDLVDEVRVTAKRNNGTRVKFAQLSEGEQQLLTVLGLLLFTQDDEALYLLDEPDTHLNPVWTYDYLALLQENIRADKGQLIVATHNPLMVGSLRKNQVRILSEEHGQTIAKQPDYDPIGLGVEGLLKSELYGLRSTLAPEVIAKIDRHYSLLGKSKRTDQDQLELIALAKELNDLGVARTHPNPYFEQFAVAMAKHVPSATNPLTIADIREQSKLADEIVTELVEEEADRSSGARG